VRTVLSVDQLGGIDPNTDAERMTVRVVRSPFNVQKAHVAREFKLTFDQLPAWGSPNAVMERGKKVRDSLCAHPGVESVLKQLCLTPPSQIQPLYIMLSESDAELISWETLCDANNTFIALDQRWPIGRISDPVSGQSRPPAELQLPVRIMALISAFGIKGQTKEWEILRDAALAARAAGLQLILKLMVGEPNLRTAIDQEIANGLTGVEIAPIDRTPSRVVQEIIAWSPHILHFFCHGRADLTDQSVELATAGDYADPITTAGSVRIGTQQLVAMSTQLSNPWLLALNCCSSGQAAKNLQSMAHQVVSAGFPAAVAMLEPVDANDAHEFTRAFYRSLFITLTRAAKALNGGATRVAFEWTEAMYNARRAICDLHNGDAPNAREWALPVLYVRGVEPFQFEQPHAEPEGEANSYKTRVQLVAEWLNTAGRNESEEKRRRVIEKVLADVPRSFWPSVDGTFGNL